MISVIITSYKEEKTIVRAINAVLENKLKNFEILVVAPDDGTLNAVRKLRDKRIRIVKDKGKGKPAALNLAVSKAKGDILVLTDGDVYVGDKLDLLLMPFENAKVGAVSGNPISVDSKDKMLGYWAYVLTKVADKRRIDALKRGKRIFCSGYLFAIRKKLFPKLPVELLSEDGYISEKVYEKGFSLSYSPSSEVYVKYPDNFSDWIKQKKRSAGGYNQIRKMTGTNIRSFGKESLGALGLFKFSDSFKEIFWILELFFARVYLWAVIYKDINMKKKSQKEIWQRVESTK